ncbi:hypothetical protein BDW22DRAFT_419538 [Trametopsis cervina]|nr:hypothetical protein BDW22DRAFT_419538 [Trametopsis cervina]
MYVSAPKYVVLERPGTARSSGSQQCPQLIDSSLTHALISLTPKAFEPFVKLLKAAGLDTDAKRRERLAGMSMDSEKMLALLTS